MKSLLALAALCSIAAAQSQTFTQNFDDTDPIITYSSGWEHQVGVNGPTNGTQSYSREPAATYSFAFTGPGFSICAGKKIDRGTFSVTIGVLVGEGNQTSTSLSNTPPCEPVFDVQNLASTGHTVVVSNTGSGVQAYLTVDYITLNVLVPDASSTSSSAPASSTSTSASSSQSTLSTVSVVGANASSSAEASSSGGTSTAAIAGGVVAGVVALALVALLWFCCARKRKRGAAQEDDTRSNPFTDGDQGSSYNPVMSQHSGGARVLFESTSTQPEAHPAPAAIPYAGAYSSPELENKPIFDSRYSVMSAAVGGSAPAPSARTSYAAPQIPMMSSDRASSPFGAFPVDEPLDEDPYGGMESEDDSTNHSRRPSSAEVAARKGSHSLKRKPVPEE